MKLRKGPVCRGTLWDGGACEARVERAGDRCRGCLARLAAGADVPTRRALAADADLPVEMFEVLGADPDTQVRLTLACREDCPLVVLQRLERDTDAEVRAAAGSAMSMAFSPRVTSGGFFTDAEAEALRQGETGDAPADPFATAGDGGRAADPPPAAGRIRRVAATTAPGVAAWDAAAREVAVPDVAVPDVAVRELATEVGAPAAVASPVAGPGAPAFDEILERLDALGDRLTTLESTLATTGRRLGALTDLLDQLGADPSARRPAHRIREPRYVDVVDLTACGPPAELDTGPRPRPEVVAAAWLSVIPLLAARGGVAAPPPTAASTSPAWGPAPLLPTVPAPVAELLPAAPPAERHPGPSTTTPMALPTVIEPAADAVTVVRASRDERRRQLHAKRRRIGR